MTSRFSNVSCIADPLWGESTGHLRFSHHNGLVACALVFHLTLVGTNGWTNCQVAGDLRQRHDAHHNVTVIVNCLGWWFGYDTNVTMTSHERYSTACSMLTPKKHKSSALLELCEWKPLYIWKYWCNINLWRTNLIMETDSILLRTHSTAVIRSQQFIRMMNGVTKTRFLEF